jgi:hypothetical protein
MVLYRIGTPPVVMSKTDIENRVKRLYPWLSDRAAEKLAERHAACAPRVQETEVPQTAPVSC